tara:strand:+ start:148 stop:324 length:177 start_codon:yes stop_codon:yes gene_type:complete
VTERPFHLDTSNVIVEIMSEEHQMTKKDKLVLGITLAAIFGGVFFLGLIGLIFNLSSG